MTIELGSVLGAVAVALIAVVGWVGPRWTKEGRLLARIRVLGQAHAALPVSNERTKLGITLTALAKDLNIWDATDQRLVRRWRFWTPIAALGVSFALVLIAWPVLKIDPSSAWLGSLTTGLVAGIASVVVTELSEFFIAEQTVGAQRAEREQALLAGRLPQAP
ncbi:MULTISPECIES: hypothetical protein [unclassified Microbacterium]|uniref:hypothetical protein n=1 Tax=unclassified Microbacterium TaxID=2609290 RepID=UPI00386BA316